jgi:hypothetical protein
MDILIIYKLANLSIKLLFFLEYLQLIMKLNRFLNILVNILLYIFKEILSLKHMAYYEYPFLMRFSYYTTLYYI